MKLKKHLKVLVLIPALWLIAGQNAGATPDFNNVTPNTYEKRNSKRTLITCMKNHFMKTRSRSLKNKRILLLPKRTLIL